MGHLARDCRQKTKHTEKTFNDYVENEVTEVLKLIEEKTKKDAPQKINEMINLIINPKDNWLMH